MISSCFVLAQMSRSKGCSKWLPRCKVCSTLEVLLALWFLLWLPLTSSLARSNAVERTPSQAPGRSVTVALHLHNFATGNAGLNGWDSEKTAIFREEPLRHCECWESRVTQQ